MASGVAMLRHPQPKHIERSINQTNYSAMEKTRLLELLKSEPSDIDAIGMILSNYTDYGHSE